MISIIILFKKRLKTLNKSYEQIKRLKMLYGFVPNENSKIISYEMNKELESDSNRMIKWMILEGLLWFMFIYFLV